MLRLQLAPLSAYIFAQITGAFVGAALVYANYFHAIDIYEGQPGLRTLKTAGLFASYPVSAMIVLRLFVESSSLFTLVDLHAKRGLFLVGVSGDRTSSDNYPFALGPAQPCAVQWTSSRCHLYPRPWYRYFMGNGN